MNFKSKTTEIDGVATQSWGFELLIARNFCHFHSYFLMKLMLFIYLNLGTTMLESMWSSMSSSMQLAQECLEKKNDCEDVVLTASNSMEGLEKFAQTIDNSKFYCGCKDLDIFWDADLLKI